MECFLVQELSTMCSYSGQFPQASDRLKFIVNARLTAYLGVCHPKPVSCNPKLRCWRPAGQWVRMADRYITASELKSFAFLAGAPGYWSVRVRSHLSSANEGAAKPITSVTCKSYNGQDATPIGNWSKTIGSRSPRNWSDRAR
jgi:hypothetical protein